MEPVGTDARRIIGDVHRCLRAQRPLWSLMLPPEVRSPGGRFAIPRDESYDLRRFRNRQRADLDRLSDAVPRSLFLPFSGSIGSATESFSLSIGVALSQH